MGFSLSLSFSPFLLQEFKKKEKQTTYILTLQIFLVLISYLVSLLFSPSSSATPPSTSCTKHTHTYKYPYEGFFKSQYQQMVLPIIRPYIGWYGKKWLTRWKCKEALECKNIKERKLKLLSIFAPTKHTFGLEEETRLAFALLIRRFPSDGWEGGGFGKESDGWERVLLSCCGCCCTSSWSGDDRLSWGSERGSEERDDRRKRFLILMEDLSK